MRFEGTVYALGLHRTLVRQDYMPDLVIALNLLRDQQFVVDEHYWHDTIHHFSPALFDEWSGRVVDCSTGGRIIVVDFVHTHLVN
ncbi:hypothetical protein BDN71DRAFT_1454405 [Pleurotus eryngii]|uniref:Uncharacterized protein n=1 Tax=Pleurotus eryngii TaxID=5323 RepID=A0A9P6DCG0_PLEER|nr:hypothetical protein BDN71DRAFT_1454405 [Pleurotus eryngii]